MQFAVKLPHVQGMPVYRQVSEALREAITSGRLKPGDRLPSTRELAEALSLSRLTVTRGFEELVAQGYIRTIVGSGAYVSETAPIPGRVKEENPINFAPPKEVKYSNYAKSLLRLDQTIFETEDVEPELNYGAPPMEHLPFVRWRELLNRSARMMETHLLEYQSEPFGYRPLRQAIAHYLYRARSLQCSPEQIVLFPSTESGLDLTSRLLLEAGDIAAVENPGFPGARRVFAANRARLLPIPVDQDGMIVSALKEANQSVAIIYVTPSHHDPTGAILPEQRRMELLQYATDSAAIVLEDDYDSEYQYGEQPVPSLFSLDTHETVIYRYNFWRVLYPLVRMGFLVIPKRLIPLMTRAKSIVERNCPLLDQHALADFIGEGHLDRQIKRTRYVYASRRAILVQALTRHLKKNVHIADTSAGLHTLVTFSSQLDENSIVHAAQVSGLPLLSTKKHYCQAAPVNEFLIGFASLQDERIADIIKGFAKIILPSA